MPAKKYQVGLSEKERQELRLLTRKGVRSARKVTRARILLLADEKRLCENIASYLRCSYGTVTRICKRYCQEGLPFALRENPGSGAPAKPMGDSEPRWLLLPARPRPKALLAGRYACLPINWLVWG